MKKVISAVAAGALLLSTVGVAFAWPHHGSFVTQNSFTVSETEAESTSGDNSQEGSGRQTMFTGDSESTAESLTVGNVNVGGSGFVRQNAFTKSETEAESTSGDNSQESRSRSHHHRSSSSQFMGTGFSGSYAGSATISNVSFSH